jgi:hypothetical protein
MEGDHVTGHQRDMRVRLICHRDGPRQLLLAQERTEMDVGQLHDAEPVQTLCEAGYRDGLFPHPDPQPLHEDAVAGYHDWGGKKSHARCFEKSPARL